MMIVPLVIAVMMQAAPMPPPQVRVDAPLPGQRQTREDAAPNVAPMSRLSTRIGSRIDARIQSRLSRAPSGVIAAYEAAADRGRGSR